MTHHAPARRSPVRPAQRARLALVVAAFVALPTALAAPAQAVQPSGPAAAPLLAPTGTRVPGRYVVVLKAGARTPAAASSNAGAVAGVRRAGGTVLHTYRAALNGYAAALTPAQLAAVRRDARVAYVVPDLVVHADATQTGGTQTGATWGLDRIDQRTRPLDGTYTYPTTADAVTAYVIDTGILAGHTEFGGRATSGFTAIGDGRGTSDCNGHGTHVSGTIGGATYGVAKAVRLVAVRVLDCSGSGTTSGVIAGIDWVTANHAGPAVANMSLGGGASTALDSAVSRSIASGVTYAVAAGNNGTNACSSSPARVGTAITVGATTSTDARASWSNYGSCLDLFAPGASITSAWNTSSTAAAVLSGTSMATPHVTGAAALYLAAHPTSSPAQVRDALVADATTGVVGNARAGSPNRLLFVRQ